MQETNPKRLKRRKVDVPKPFPYKEFKESRFELSDVKTYQRFWESCIVGVVLNIWVNQMKRPKNELAELLESLGRSSAERALYAKIKKSQADNTAQHAYVSDLLFYAEALGKSPASLVEVVDYEVKQMISERQLSGEHLPDFLQAWIQRTSPPR